MNQVILLAIALAMDAFAVSIGLGANQASKNKRHARNSLLFLSLLAGLYFGVAQGIMPFIGYILGSALLGWLALAAPWIGCLILVSLGFKMLYDVFQNDDELEVASIISHKVMLSMAIATSIDALAAGFTLNLIPVTAWISCFIIAVITAILSFIGVLIGHKSGTWLEDKAELLGGVVLIGIGINMVL